MSLSPEQLAEIRAAAREASRRSRVEQGLPPKVTDAAVLERVAALVRDGDEKSEAA